jgi:hypothetical protein
MESNHLPIGYRPIARPESFAGMEPGVGIELTCPVYKTGASPRMLTRRTHLEPVPGMRLLCHWATPAGASAENRTPLTGLAIRCPTNRPHPRKTLERTEIIEVSSLGWRPRAHPIYHARLLTLMLIQLSKTCHEAHLQHIASSRKQVRQVPQVTDKNKKRGRPFLVAALFLKSECYSKTVRSPRRRHDSCASRYLGLRPRIGISVSRILMLIHFF